MDGRTGGVKTWGVEEGGDRYESHARSAYEASQNSLMPTMATGKNSLGDAQIDLLEAGRYQQL